MDKKQRLFLYITAVSAIFLSAAAIFAGISLHTRSLAMRELKKDTALLVTENEALKTRRDFLYSDVSSKSDNSLQKDTLNKNITNLTEKLAEAKSELSAVSLELNSLNTKNAETNKLCTALSRGMNPVKGAYQNADSTRLMCPAQIRAGRYIVTGSGTITVISPSGAARISENLSEVETNSYTFDLENNEEIETHGAITITELK